MLSLFTEYPNQLRIIISVPFDSTPAVFDSKVPFVCHTIDHTNFFQLEPANIFIDVLLNGTLFPAGA